MSNWRPLRRIDFSRVKVSLTGMSDPSKAVSGLAAESPAAPAVVAALADPAVTTKARRPFVQSPGDRSLDQWRGVALVFVLISHGFKQTGNVEGVGRVGVNLFFFISGILVFRSLSKGPQELAAGAKYFWIRRTKRLVPAKWFYLFCMSLLLLVIWTPPVTDAFRESFFRGLPSSFLYYRNYYVSLVFGNDENLAGHLWSLACEMQFYILAPLIFFAGGQSIVRRSVVYAAVLVAMLGGGMFVIGRNGYNHYSFQVAAWPMMVGFFAAFLHHTFPKHVARWGKPLFWIGVASCLPLVWAMLSPHVDVEAHKQVVVLAGTFLVAGSFGCYLEGIAPVGFAGNAFHYLGNRTYSIYLWQQPLTIGGLLPTTLALSGGALMIPVHAIGSLLSIPIGALSFRYLEQPFMSKYKPKPATKDSMNPPHPQGVLPNDGACPSPGAAT